MNIIEVVETSDVNRMNELLVCNSSDPIVLSLKRSATGTACGYYIKNIGAGDVTVTPVVNDFIDGSATRVLTQYESIYIIDYSLNNWIVISNNYITVI